MSTDDLTEALRIAGQMRRFPDPSRNERAIVALADEVDRLRAERDGWAMQWRGADDMFGAMRDERDELRVDLDAARAALERVRAIATLAEHGASGFAIADALTRALEGES